VTAIFVRDGRYEGSALLGPKGGGRGRALSILRRLFVPARSNPRARRTSVERDSQILNSWLANGAETVSRVDLDSRRDASSALSALEEAVEDFLVERGSITHHR
jgi:hypothetical protein